MLNMRRARVAYEAALREAVRADRDFIWVAGVPALWGDYGRREVRRLWGTNTDYRTVRD